MVTSFTQSYPNLTYWVESSGWIELGQDDYSRSLIRILDKGGLAWESQERYDSLDAALQEAEVAIADWFKERGVEDAL